MKEFTLDILTPVAPVFHGMVRMVVAPGQDGYFGMLAGHAPLVAALRPGVIRAQMKDGDQEWRCGAGMACVEPGLLTLLVESLADASGADQSAQNGA